MSFVESLRLAIALGLTIFMVLLRFDAERIMRSDYFRYRTAWLAPISYYALVFIFALGITFVLPSGRLQLFLTGGLAGTVFPVMVAFSVVAVLNGAAFAYLRYGGVVPMPVELLPSRLVGAAVNAVAEEIQFRSLVLGMLLFAFPTQPVAMNLLQAILYGVVHRRLWNERDWYFLIGSVILGAAAGAATIATGSVVPAMVGHFAVTVSLFAFAGGRLRQRPV